jgi:hypothetical protein
MLRSVSTASHRGLRRDSRVVLVTAVAAAADLARVRRTAGRRLARDKLAKAAGRGINGSEGDARVLSREIQRMSDMAEGEQRPRRSQDNHGAEQDCEKEPRTTQQENGRGMDRGETKGDGSEHQASLLLLSNVRDVSSGQPASGSRKCSVTGNTTCHVTLESIRALHRRHSRAGHGTSTWPLDACLMQVDDLQVRTAADPMASPWLPCVP